MKTPWFVSRFVYDEMKAQLCSERDAAVEEKRRVLDMFARRATGEPLFYPDPAEPEPEAVPEEESADPRVRAVRRLRSRGVVRPTARMISQECERESAEDFERSNRGAINANRIPDEMRAAQEAGRASAKTVTN